MKGGEWLGKRVRVFAAYDSRKEHGPIAEGEIVAYIDGPSVIVRDASGNQQGWPVSLPIEESRVTAEEMHKLVDRYCSGDISAEDYYAAMDDFAHRVIR